jgi:hypothetical protein
LPLRAATIRESYSKSKLLVIPNNTGSMYDGVDSQVIVW